MEIIRKIKNFLSSDEVLDFMLKACIVIFVIALLGAVILSDEIERNYNNRDNLKITITIQQ